MSNDEKACGALIIILIALVVGPLVGIWTINTLFDVNNPYDLPHMFAVICAGVFLWGSN